MSKKSTDRLESIRAELAEILEARVSELMTTMRESEELTRRILASELEAARAKQLREDLDAQTEAIQGDLDALHQRAEQVRESHRAALKERDETRDELQEVASGESSWKMSAPGLGNASVSSDAPLDYKLSQTLKRQRAELERAHRRLQDLEVEANLAGVPETWRRPPAASR